jgi:hypothetical protein
MPEHKVKTGYSQSPERGAGNAIFFVSNLLSSSQAGRRGFEPRLPLHFFNNLHGHIANRDLQENGVTSFFDRSELIALFAPVPM